MKGPETLKDFLTQNDKNGRNSEKEMMKMGDWKKIHFLIAAIFLEISAKNIAFFLFHRNKIPYKWDYAKSTKNLDG